MRIHGREQNKHDVLVPRIHKMAKGKKGVEEDDSIRKANKCMIAHISSNTKAPGKLPHVKESFLKSAYNFKYKEKVRQQISLENNVNP